LKKLIVGILLLVCSFGAAARAAGYRVPVLYQQELRNHPSKRPWQDEERRRHEEERRHEERRRQDKERQRHEERRRQDEEQRRHEERRRQDEEQRRHEERRRQDEERRRHEERRRQDEEQRRHEEERRRQDEEQRRHEEERRRQDEEQRRHEEERRRQDEEQRRHEKERRRFAPKPPQPRLIHLVPHHQHWGQQKARQVLRKTAKLLIWAQKAAKHGHYHYGLGRAYAHQEEARNLYSHGWYDRAIAHSLYARKIARNIITENQPGRSRCPGYHPVYDDPLDKELRINIADDNVALTLRINLN
jgi:hypothetical protein